VGSAGEVGVGEGVSVGRIPFSENEVGVLIEGWKAVGVGDAFGATVTSTNGKAAGAATGTAVHALRRIESQTSLCQCNVSFIESANA
jgi:hypothetical protein